MFRSSGHQPYADIRHHVWLAFGPINSTLNNKQTKNVNLINKIMYRDREKRKRASEKMLRNENDRGHYMISQSSNNLNKIIDNRHILKTEITDLV